jgi:hypothetical protein
VSLYLIPFTIIPLAVIVINIIHLCKIAPTFKEKIIGSLLVIFINIIIGKILYNLTLSICSGDLGIITVLVVFLQATPIITYTLFMKAYTYYKKIKNNLLSS